MSTEDHSTNVHVKMDIMMMVTPPNVILVAISVEPVTKLLDVLTVLYTENKF